MLEIIETPIFTRVIRELLGDEEYKLLQWGLVARPDLGVLVPGGNGLRKLRWAGSSGGKRGGLRILYFWDRGTGTVYLLYVYSKRAQADLTSSQIATLAKLISEEFE